MLTTSYAPCTYDTFHVFCTVVLDTRLLCLSEVLSFSRCFLAVRWLCMEANADLKAERRDRGDQKHAFEVQIHALREQLKKLLDRCRRNEKRGSKMPR